MIGGRDGLHGMYPCPSEDDVERARVLDYAKDEENGDWSNCHGERNLTQRGR